MPNNNVAILSIMSKFDEKSAREAAKRADKVYEEALSDIGNVNFDKKLIENFDKAMNLLKNKFKKVNLSSYTNSLLDSIFSDKDIKEKSKDIELFISKIEMLKKASSGQDINAFNTFSAKQIDALISRTEKLAQKQEEINDKTREYTREATKIAKANRSISTIDKNYGNQDYSKTLESLKKSLGTENEFTAEQNQSIENLAKIVNLYQAMEKSEPQKGTAEAIRYSKDLLAVTQKIKEERDKIDSFSQKGASAYITNNGLSSIDKVSEFTVNRSKEDFVKASLSNLKAQEVKIQSELTTYISESVQKNLAKVSKEVDAVVDKAEKRVENLQNKIESLQTKSTKTGSDNSLIGGIISETDIKSLEEIEDRLYAISDLDAEGEATKQQLEEYIQLYKQYEQLIASDSTVKFDPGLKEEYDFILESDSKLKKYADTLDETISKQKELNAVKSNESEVSVDTQTEQLVKQEEQIKETIQAEKQLQDAQEKLSSNTKISVDAEQAIADINKIKENLDSIPKEKNIKITISDSDYTNTPLLSNELGEVVTAFRGVKDAWSGLINDKGIGFFTDKLKLAVDYADELSKDGKVYQANLSFHNPLEVDGKGARWDQIDFNGIKQKTDDIIQLAKQLGHDGVIFKNIRDGFTDTDEDISNVMVALNAAQIKNEHVIGAVKAGTGEMVDVASKIDNATDTVTNSTVESQNKIQEELKETQKVAERVSEAMNNVGSDKSNISSENLGDKLKQETNESEKNFREVSEVVSSFINTVRDISSQTKNLFESGNVSQFKESSAFFDPYNNTMLSDIIVGDFANTNAELTRAAREHLKDIYENIIGYLHSHPAKIASFSNEDLFNQIYNFINDGIYRQIVIASDEIMELDYSQSNPTEISKFAKKFNEISKQMVEMIFHQLTSDEIIGNINSESNFNGNFNQKFEDSAEELMHYVESNFDEQISSFYDFYIDAIKGEDGSFDISNTFKDSLINSQSEEDFIAQIHLRLSSLYDAVLEDYTVSPDNSDRIKSEISSYKDSVIQRYILPDILSIYEDFRKNTSESAEKLQEKADLFDQKVIIKTLESFPNKIKVFVGSVDDFIEKAKKSLEISPDESSLISKQVKIAGKYGDVSTYGNSSNDAIEEFVRTTVEDTNNQIKECFKSFTRGLISEDSYDSAREDILKELNQKMINSGIEEISSFTRNNDFEIWASTDIEKLIKKIREHISDGLSEWTVLQQELNTYSNSVKSTSSLLETSSTSPMKDVFQSETEKSGMDDISTATEEAVQAKKDFATANEGVQESVEESKSPLQLESDLMNQIAKNAKEAAKSKKEFVKANKQVKSGSEESAKSVEKEAKALLEKVDNKLISYTGDYSKFNSRNSVTPEYISLVERYNEALTKLRNKVNYFNNNGISTKNDIKELKDLEKEVKTLNKQIKSMPNTEKGSAYSGINSLFSQLYNLKNTFKGMTKEQRNSIDELERKWKKLGNTLNLEEAKAELRGLEAELKKAETATDTLWSALQEKMFYRTAAQFAKYFSAYDIIRYVKQGVDVLNDFDDGLTKISYTMDMTKSQLRDLGKSVVEMSNDLDTSINNAMQVSQIYANMNTSAEDIKKLSEPTLILSNLTGFDAATIADDIQAVSQQFEIAAEESMHIADVYDYISRNIQVDYGKGIESIAEGIKVAGSTAKQAGLDFEQTSAIIAKAVEKTRLDGSQVGNGLKTILVRTSKVGELSDEVDNETLSQASEALNKIGIEIYNLDGTYREFDVIMGELANKWNTLSDAEKSNISFALAATRQTNLLSAILSNFSDSMQLATEATQQNGSALENNQKWIDSFSGRLQALETTAQTAWIKILDSDTIKGGIDLLNGLLKIVTEIIDEVGIIPTIGTGVGIYKFVKNLDHQTVLKIA